jgi:DNA-directed RNA polymerase subunit RPC12/RpoP
LKCLPCNAPTTRTIDDNYVCVDCGETVVALDGTPSDPTAGPVRESTRPATDSADR